MVTRFRSAPFAPFAAIVVSAVALSGLSAAPSHAAAPIRKVCGAKLAADEGFSSEVKALGRSHACEHLRGRSAGQRLRSRSATRTRGTVSAAAANATSGGTPAELGSWSAAKNPGTKTVGISAVLFHTGEVLLFGGKYASTDRNTASFLFDPVTGTGHEVPAPAAVFCGSVTQLSDGRVLSAGGADPVPKGIVDLWLFDPISEKWSRQPDTPLGRYYPTSTRLADGRILISSGNALDGKTKNPDTEVYSPPAAGGEVGTLTKVGTDHPSSFYPHQWLMPDGKVLQLEARRSWAIASTDWLWKRLPLMPATIGQGSSSLMYDDANGHTNVLTAGGVFKGVAQPDSFLYDYEATGAQWTRGTPLPEARSHMSLVTTPDGKAIGIGGNSRDLYDDGVHRTLSYDPSTKVWTPMAMQSPRRAYHSTAVLLPDGRIMSAGDTGVGGGRRLIDYYSPPYLFKGARPSITTAPSQVANGGSMSIAATGPSATKAVLMAPAANTHTVEMNARRVELDVTRTAGGLSARVPGATVAPPGYYMLFVLTPDGVPSTASWVHVGR